MKTAIVFLLLCLAAAVANAAAAVGHGVLCLTFDDSRFAEWEAALPIFERHGAHATFFAYHKIDEKAVASMRRLSEAGHSIGLHGFKHQFAPDVVAKLGEDGYIADEIEPQLSVCRAAGLPVRSFAYPCSRHTSQTDALLLRYFSRLRGGGDFKGAFPASEAATRRYLPGLGIGPRYKRGGAEVAAMLPAVAESNLVLVVYSHGIGKTAEGINMSQGDLETILSAAESLGVEVIGFDELNDIPLSLKWTCSGHASIQGNNLIVDVPEGREKSGGVAMASIDLSAFEGRSVSVCVQAEGRGITKPLHWYNGLKLQLEYEDAESGEVCYPNTQGRLGDFTAQTIVMRDFSEARRRRAHLTLGLQESAGRVTFDLSTLRIGEAEPLWPVTNRNLKCAYTADVRNAPLLRGVMSPSPRKMTKEDFDALSSWGVTLVRYQMGGYGQKKGAPVDFDAYIRWLDGKLLHFDTFVLPEAVRRGMKVVLDLHEPPGNRDVHGDTRMLHDRKCADFFVETWRRIARRFKGREGIYGYDLVNEPMQNAEALPDCDFWSIQRRAAEAIREIDKDTPILVECNGQDSPYAFASFSPMDLTNIIYEVHMYLPLAYTHQGVLWKQGKPKKYPDAAKGWGAESVRGGLRPVRDFQLRHGAKIYAGEFSAIAWAPGADEYMRDCIAAFEEYGWDWTYHAFREWKGWSVEHEGADAQHLVPSADNPRKRALMDCLKGLANRASQQ